MNTSAPEEPKAVSVESKGGELVVHLQDGRAVHVPLDWFPRLRDASPEDLADWRLIGRGVGISWPKLEEDLSVRRLLFPATAGRSRSG